MFALLCLTCVVYTFIEKESLMSSRTTPVLRIFVIPLSVLTLLLLSLRQAQAAPPAPYLVADINSIGLDSFPSGLVDVNGTLYFVADDGTNGRELWKSDGTD